MEIITETYYDDYSMIGTYGNFKSLSDFRDVRNMKVKKIDYELRNKC